MDTPLISVIVPVYKVEAYLDRCVQSIVDQTYRNLEIILVDDGSPDNCGAMCDTWAKKDNRVMILHTLNHGSAAARNAALDIAQGELIAFVDSDDYLEPTMFFHLYELISSYDADISECAYILVAGDIAPFNLTSNAVRAYDVHDAMYEHICNCVFQQVIWNKLYRRNTIGDIRFPVGKKIDDEFFTYRVIGNARRLVHSEKTCYAYRQQSDSIMHTTPVLEWFRGVEAKVSRHEYIMEHFPQLECISYKSIINNCLYLNQLAMRGHDTEISKALMDRTTSILENYPLKKSILTVMTLTERFWLIMANWNLALTCKIRNLLRIGL